MLSKVLSCALLGIEAYVVEVEVDLAPGLPTFATVGLPDAVVKESRDRIKSAIKNSGFDFPLKHITINLAPADIKKEGSALDLPMAIGILRAQGLLAGGLVDRLLLVGELALDGRVKPVRGALPMALTASRKGLAGILLPEENADEGAVVKGIEVFPIKNLSQTVDFLGGHLPIPARQVNAQQTFTQDSTYETDFAEVKGQLHVKRALEVSSAGGHNILMIGPPGSGKSMLAKRLPTILPDLSLEEAIETTTIHSIAGLTQPHRPLIAIRPFRSPHHTISDAGLVGGGQIPTPGEVSLAHNGVLFLDELPEFRRNALEALRQPLEEGVVTISRVSASLTYPARFMLAAAMNPCPCGYRTDPRRSCACTPPQIRGYLARVSGPLLDRIDIHVEVPAVGYRELSEASAGESSTAIRRRVSQARQIQRRRFSSEARRLHCNAQMEARHLKHFCQISAQGRQLLELAMARLGLSARAHNRILKVARTVADLAGTEEIHPQHLAEAIQYRSLDREQWLP